MSAPSVQVSRLGVTRLVILVGPWAIKLPRFGYGWSLGLRGLLCNMQERAFAKTGWPELCPVVAALPGGWALVMKRCRPLTDEEWRDFDAAAFRDSTEYQIPVELKDDSFGVLAGRIVALDYGS